MTHVRTNTVRLGINRAARKNRARGAGRFSRVNISETYSRAECLEKIGVFLLAGGAGWGGFSPRAGRVKLFSLPYSSDGAGEIFWPVLQLWAMDMPIDYKK